MSIRSKIIALVIFLQLILTITMGSLFLHEHSSHEQDTLKHIGKNLKNNLLRENHETETLYPARLKKFVSTTAGLIAAFSHNNQAVLGQLSQRKLAELRQEDPAFSAIAFIAKNGNVIYHTTDPARIGDNVGHVPFAKDSLENRKPINGLVLSLGGLAYRFSYPVYQSERYLGIIVFAVKPTRALELASQDFGVCCGIFIDNRFVDRLQKEERFSREDKTLITSTGRCFTNRAFLEKFPLVATAQAFKLQHQSYQKFPAIPIKNYRGSVIGEIQAMLNTTGLEESFERSLYHSALICLGVFIITIIVLHAGTGFFLQRVKQLQSQLETKVFRRTQALQTLNEKLSQEIRERKRSQKALQEMSENDMLTNIYNRRKFNTYFSREWDAALREKRVVSLLMIDIDYFKNYNDHYGHLAGDDALIAVAATLKNKLTRPRDFVARYGGEEFVCLLPETSMDAAIYLAEKLRLEIQKLNYVHEYSVAAGHITISVGVASAIPTAGQAKEDLIDQADKALYRAKEAGRNCTKAV